VYVKIVKIQPTRKTFHLVNDIILEKVVLEPRGCMNCRRGNYDSEKLAETRHLDREIWEKT